MHRARRQCFPAPWWVWLAYVRFANHSDVGKMRPVVIIDERAAAIVVAKVATIQPQERFAYCELADWNGKDSSSPRGCR